MSPSQPLATRLLYGGRIIHLHEERVLLPSGQLVDLEIVHHPGAAAVVPVDDDDNVLLVRQFRHATGGWILEVPAGKLDRGEPPDLCALREVEEETGYRPRRLESLGWVWTTPGFTDEKIWLFAGRDLEPGRQQLQRDEVLSVVRVPRRQAVEMARSGEIVDAKSVCALLRFEGGAADAPGRTGGGQSGRG